MEMVGTEGAGGCRGALALLGDKDVGAVDFGGEAAGGHVNFTKNLPSSRESGKYFGH